MGLAATRGRRPSVKERTADGPLRKPVRADPHGNSSDQEGEARGAQ